MVRVCTICTHPNRHDIDAALEQQEPYRAIAVQYGVSKGALQRHVANHLPKGEMATFGKDDDASRARGVPHKATDMSSAMQKQVEFLHRLKALVDEAGVLLEEMRDLVQRIGRPKYAAQRIDRRGKPTAQQSLEESLRRQQRLVAEMSAKPFAPDNGVPGTSDRKPLGDE